MMNLGEVRVGPELAELSYCRRAYYFAHPPKREGVPEQQYM